MILSYFFIKPDISNKLSETNIFEDFSSIGSRP